MVDHGIVTLIVLGHKDRADPGRCPVEAWADAEGITVVEVGRSVERGVLANSALEAHSRSARMMTRWGKS